MLFVKMENGKAVAAAEKNFDGAKCRWDWKSFDEAKKIADDLNYLNDAYMSIDCGANVSPRYDVIHRPQVGDEISYGFNGDYYPDGKIVKVSASLRVIKSDTGSTYYRQGSSGRWVKQGGTWSMIKGNINRRNPSF